MSAGGRSGRGSGPLAEQLHEHVRAAAALRLEILAFERDRNAALQDGTRIFYCIDTNVIALYLRPKKQSVDGRYGVVFPEDSEKTAFALGGALSRYIFHNLIKSIHNEIPIPLVLLPGHDAEARRIYDSVSRALADDRDGDRRGVSEQRDRLGKVLDLVFSDANASNQQVLEKYEQEFFDLMYGSDSVLDQLNRFNQLIARSSIARLSVVSSSISRLFHDEAMRRACRKALSAPSDLHEQIEESALRLAWERALLRHKSASISPLNSRADVAALARLELINRRLESLNARLVLITGDQAMHRAADRPAGTDGESFGHLYLRHPRAFLASTQLLARGAGAPDEGDAIGADLVVDWLDALLARYHRQYSAPNEKALRRIAYPSDERIPDQIEAAAAADSQAVEAIRQDWDAHVALIRIQHSSVSEIARGEIRRILGAARLGDHEGAMREVDALLVRQSEDTWQSFLAAMAHAGFDISQDDGARRGLRARNVPPISFDSFRHTSDFVREALAAPKGTDLRRSLMDALPGIDSDDSGVGYAKMLAYATLHAHDGNWYVASILADRAISIAERLAINPVEKIKEGLDHISGRSEITGREAYYFSAIARRHCARRVEDLERVGILLDKAELALEKDLARTSPPDISSLKFQAERAATSLSRILFVRFVGAARDAPPTSSDDLTELRTRFYVLALRAREESLAASSSRKRISLIVERKSAVNFFMTAALLGEVAEYGRKSGSDKDGELENQLLLMRDILPVDYPREDGENFALMSETSLVRAIHIYAEALLGATTPRARISLERNISEFRSLLMSFPSREFVMPYDKDRFYFLLDRSEKLLRKKLLL